MAAAGLIDAFTLPAHLEAAEPPEARGLKRDDVRLLVSHVDTDSIAHARFSDLPGWLSPGDLLVVNTSGTLKAALAARTRNGHRFELHLSTRLPGNFWVIEVRRPGPVASLPCRDALAGAVFELEAGGVITVLAPYPLDGALKQVVPAVDCSTGAGWSGASVPRTIWQPDSLQLRHQVLAGVDVPDSLRDRARQRGNAVGRTSIHRRARHAARVRRDPSRTRAAACRRRQPGRPRTALRRVFPRDPGDRRSCELDEARWPSRCGGGNHGRAGARNCHGLARGRLARRGMDEPGDWSGTAAASGKRDDYRPPRTACDASRAGQGSDRRSRR